MDDNFFRPGTKDDRRFSDFHDEAFEIMDTADTNPTKGWPKGEKESNATYNKPSNSIGNMKDEMKSTMDTMNNLTDKSSCGCSSKNNQTAGTTGYNNSNDTGSDNLRSNDQGVNDLYDRGVELDIIEIDIIDAGDDFADDNFNDSYEGNNFRSDYNDNRNNTFSNESNTPKGSCGCSSKSKNQNVNDYSSNNFSDNNKKEDKNQFRNDVSGTGKRSCGAKKNNDSWNDNVTTSDREMMNNNYNSSYAGSDMEDLEQGSEFAASSANKSRSCSSKK